MGTEIERKFLVRSDAWRDAADAGTEMRQGYLSTAERATVRVRTAGDKAWLTIKGKPKGLARAEYEYEVPVGEAAEMLDQLCGNTVDKCRYRVTVGAHVWEVDVFAGANAGLIVAEVELGAADERFERPSWAGDEVSSDGRYANARLAVEPFSTWGSARS